MAIIRDIIELMDFIAPPWMAEAGDVIGLQAGDPRNRVKKILVALDATDKVIDYACKNKCEMIVTHHPRFYHPLNNVCRDSFAGNIAYLLCKHEISLFNAHTNFDAVPGGVNDVLADIAGINGRKPVMVTAVDKTLKLTVYIPKDALEDVREALAEAGAGETGNYTDCSYRTIGSGVFKPQSGAKPQCGNIGELTEVEEWRLEALLPESLKNNIENVLLAAHPYEEPAYDFTSVSGGTEYGQGRVGDLRKGITLAALAKKYKKETGSNCTFILGEKNKIISRLAVWSGSGVEVKNLIAAEADCVVCGELGYHLAEELEYHGISAIVLGHGPCEEIALKVIVQNLLNGTEGVDVLLSPRLWPDFISI